MNRDDEPSRFFLMSLRSLFAVGAGTTAPLFVVGFAVYVGAALFIAAGGRTTLEVMAKGASLQVGLDVCDLLGLAAVVDSLGPLPRFDTNEEENGFDEDDAPFPADTRVLEDNCVEHGDVDDREHGDKASHNSPE